MSTSTIERPRTAGPGSALGGNWRVIVHNANHNTFDHVAQTLARVLPGVTLEQGHRIADQIHNGGQAIVWTGPREPAEHYWEQLGPPRPTGAPPGLLVNASAGSCRGRLGNRRTTGGRSSRSTSTGSSPCSDSRSRRI